MTFRLVIRPTCPAFRRPLRRFGPGGSFVLRRSTRLAGSALILSLVYFVLAYFSLVVFAPTHVKSTFVIAGIAS